MGHVISKLFISQEKFLVSQFIMDVAHSHLQWTELCGENNKIS